MTAPAPPPDLHPGRWRMLALLATAELLGMSLWFAASAVAPEIAARFALSPAETGWLTSAVQLGFVAGTAAVALLNLADIVPAGRLFALSALLGAAANAALLAVPGFSSLLAARFATGFFLAGVYPPAMKMISTWFKARRGESPRVSRRLLRLRGWSHEEVREVFPRSAGASGADGVGAPLGTRLGVVGDPLDRRQDRLYG